MTPLDAFLSYVLPDCPGASEAGANAAIISAAIEFCEKSLVLQTDHDPVDVRTGVEDYDLSPPTGMLVCKVLKAWYRRRVLTPMGPDDMDDPTIYNAAAGALPGEPLYFLQKDKLTVSLWPIPQADLDKGLTMRVAVKPMRASTTVDDILFEDWVEVIANGAKANLMVTPGKTFTNLPVASANQGAFVAGINRAIMRANKGNTRANLSVRMRRL